MSDDQAPPPAEEKAPETIDLRAAFSQQVHTTQQALAAIQEINDPDQTIIHLHNASFALLQLCTLIIGVTIFPEDVNAEAANDEKSSIITD